MIEEELNTIREAARESIVRIEESHKGPLNLDMQVDFISKSLDINDFDDYKVFPNDIKTMINSIQKTQGVSERMIFLRVVLLRAIISTSNDDFIKQLPPRVLESQLGHLKRIASDVRTKEDWLDISHDTFHKEFGLATLRLLSAGSQVVDVRCGVPRSILIKDGIAKLPYRLSTFYKLGGFRPFFQIHTHMYTLDKFNEAGWDECYRCCSELYHLFPNSLGMFGSSWFYDPVLEHISPRLNYLRETPLKGGATIFFNVAGGTAITDSTATSRTRRELFESGRYNPKNYMLVWGRRDQIAWADEHKGP